MDLFSAIDLFDNRKPKEKKQPMAASAMSIQELKKAKGLLGNLRTYSPQNGDCEKKVPVDY